MARGKKKAAELSPEEKLEQALVPVEEQPYEIPENWCWVRLESLVNEIKNGTTIKQDKSGEGYSVTRIESLQNQTIDFNRLGSIIDDTKIKDTDWYVDGDVALSHINSAEHVGKTAVITADMLPLVHGMNLLRLRFNGAYLPVLFQYYTQSFEYKEAILQRINMAVNQVSINQKQLGSLEMPVAPIAEQQRIVDRIESIFAKLDEAKEKAQAVVDGFEFRKSAILHKAFTGELTAQWRQEHGVGLESWENCTIGDIFELRAGKNISASKIEKERSETHLYPCFGGNGIRGYVENYNRDGVFPIIGRQGALCGNINVASGTFYATEHAVVVSNKKEVALSWAVNYLKFMNLNQYATATAQPGLAVSNIVKVPMKYSTFEEQIEISRILDSLLTKEAAAKAAAEAVLDQIDTMKKAVLARAFRGELGTNDPAEESAVELLKTVLG